jgi:MFS transporter, PAT family, beta-lactamase induction signal transducer AmpG
MTTDEAIPGPEPGKGRPLPPIWLMGLGFLPLGASGSVTLINVPQLLAANHVPEPQIAVVITISLFPGFIGFFLAPMLDWRFSRRVYAIGFTVLAALLQFAALLVTRDLTLLAVLLFVQGLAIGQCVAAVGGWFGNLTPAEQKGSLGVWFTVANLGAGGLVASLAIPLLRGLPYVLGDALLSATLLLALPLFFWVECPPADGRLASESFKAFAADVLALLRRPTVLWTLLLFVAPAASFALTNTLGGLGRDFGASEAFVGLVGGLGISVAGVVGSLAVLGFAKLIPPRPLYLLIGLFGAAFSLLLVALQHTPFTFGVAMLGENFCQAMAFSVASMIILRTVGHDNPLAATQFGLLNSAGMLPLTYMEAVDGHAYGALGGVNGSFLADAGVSGAACVLLALVLWTCRRWIPAI